MNQEQIDYLQKYKPKKLTGDFDRHALYQTEWGAVTIERALELEKVRANWLDKLNNTPKVNYSEPKMSYEMGIQNERCIDEYGCAAFG